jgi:hypothetical protein
MGEVIVLHPILNKNLSRIFKIHSRFPGIALGKQTGKTGEKNGFVILGKAVLEGESGFRTPPGVVSGIRGGGGSEFT